jgi:hypothetical protein
MLNDEVLTWIKSDINREIWLAQETERRNAAGEPLGPYPGAGNLMCALALVCYTEFFGSFVTGKKRSTQRNFSAMFVRMRPPAYKNLLEKHPNLADTLRNGLVHEYAIKGPSVVWMTGAFPGSRGIIEGPGMWHFIIDAYARDLFDAADKLFADLRVNPVTPT